MTTADFAQHLDAFAAMMQASQDYPQREDFEVPMAAELVCVHDVPFDAWCPECVVLV